MFKSLKLFLTDRSGSSSPSEATLEKRAIKDAKKAAKRELYAQMCRDEELLRWGPIDPEVQEEHGQSVRAIVHRYQRCLGILHLMNPEHNKDYLVHLKRGYFEPIPTAWTKPNGPLTQMAIKSFQYDDAAEERMYWCMNNSIHYDDAGKVIDHGPRMKPDQWSELKMANDRIRSAVPIDERYASKGDTFKSNNRYASRGYSPQVAPLVISSAFNQLFENQAIRREHGGQGHGTDEVDIMILLDVSSSMGWNHVAFDQPRHVDVVHNILRRAVHHMEVRDAYANQGGAGVETITFNNTGQSIGKISWGNFEQKWKMIEQLVYRGGGTRIMTGWQLVKETHFRKHGGGGRAWRDPIFGWQATPRMPKLSLLVVLDGEANDMDELEMELLGEKWAYVSVCLIGRENCPDHHRHANELTRIAKANDHIQFLDVHGRICERLVVSDILKRVYASSAPGYDEIMDPQWDTPSPNYKK